MADPAVGGGVKINLRRFLPVWGLLVLAASGAGITAARAARLDLRTYGRADGLTSLVSTCLLQDGRGAIVACTQDGLFVYEGHHFVALGHAQGLPDSAEAEDLLQSAGGFIYVRYANAVYVSDQPSTAGLSFPKLHFRPLPLGAAFFNDGERQIAPWSGGIALVDNGAILDFADDGSRTAGRRLDLPPANDRSFGQVARLFAINGTLWFTTDRNEICRFAPGQPSCIGRSDGLPDLTWRDLAAGDGRLVLARSAAGVAVIDPATRHVVYSQLPGQTNWPDTMRVYLGFFHDPQGRLMTQGTSGLIVQTATGWQPVSFADLPHYGGIAAVLADRSGELWIGTYERGVSRVLGYGNWDSLDTSGGSSDGLVWGTARDRAGHLWVTTDNALEEYDDSDGTARLLRSIPGGTYAVAVGPDGRVWAGGGLSGIRIVDPATGAFTQVQSPLVTELAVGGRRVWVGTTGGLFSADAGATGPIVLESASGRVRDVTALDPDGAGGLWFTSGTTLVHLGADGTRHVVIDRWPVVGFQPLCMTRAGDHLWVGGSGGLFDIRLDGERIVSIHRYDASVTGDNTVVAVLADRAGRIWAGTGSGIAAYDGTRWVSADATSGLVWDDVSQDGISEDGDGTIWIATGNGLSHLLHPERLFRPSAPDVLVQDLRLDGKALPADAVPYSTEPLTFTLATTRYASEDSIRFRYRMTGVDAGWVAAASDQVRYASVPPGRHELIVDAQDTLTHLSARPATIVVSMGWPWWERWWAELGEVLLAIGTVLAVSRWQTARLERNQLHLEHLVVERTKELELRTYEIEQSRRRVEDQAAMLEKQAAVLRSQAMRDGLTGLLNRVTIERRLAETLRATDERRECAVALLDVDHFKLINDRHGHLRGDQVLRDTARRLAGGLGPNDAAGRYGGEEFIVVLDDRDGCAAERLLALHERIRGECFLIGETPERVTVSIGLAWLRSDDDWESLVERADKALYVAKRSGRDRIVEEETPRPRRRAAVGLD